MKKLAPYLRKEQRNRLYISIKNEGFKHSDFAANILKGLDMDANPYKIPQIIHKSTGYYFNFHYNIRGYRIEYSPGLNSDVGPISIDEDLTWEDTARFFSEWLKELKIELEMPDLWEELSSVEDFKTSADNSYTSEDLFSDDEIKKITDGVKTIKKFIVEEHQIDDEHRVFVEDSLNYLVRAAKEGEKKKHWFNRALGTFVSISLRIGLGAGAPKLLKVAGDFLKEIYPNLPSLLH